MIIIVVISNYNYNYNYNYYNYYNIIYNALNTIADINSILYIIVQLDNPVNIQFEYYIDLDYYSPADIPLLEGNWDRQDLSLITPNGINPETTYRIRVL